MFEKARKLRSRIREKAEALARTSAPAVEALVRASSASRAIVNEQDLPVVARLVVEIRSDGSQTVARGAMEDLASGERVMVRADGTTPLALAGSLAKSMLSIPALALQAARAVADAKKGEKPGS